MGVGVGVGVVVGAGTTGGAGVDVVGGDGAAGNVGLGVCLSRSLVHPEIADVTTVNSNRQTTKQIAGLFKVSIYLLP